MKFVFCQHLLQKSVRVVRADFCYSVLITIEEAVNLPVELVGDYLIQLDILDAAEYIHHNLRILLRQLCDELLYCLALGSRGSVRIAGRAGVREPACALYKVQIVVLRPVLDLVLPYEVHRADKLHSREIRAVQLRHHGFHLTAVDHAHEYRFDHVVEVVPQCDLIAAQLLCLIVEVTTAHSRAEVAGIVLYIVHGVEYIRFEHGDRDPHQLRVRLDYRAVLAAVARVHHQEYQIEVELAVALYLLEKLRHQHGVLAAGNAYRHPVAGLQQLVFVQRLREFAEYAAVEFPRDTTLNLCGAVGAALHCDLLAQPADVPSGEVRGGITALTESLGDLLADDSAAAAHDDILVRGEFHAGYRVRRNIHGVVYMPERKRGFIAHVYQHDLLRRNAPQFADCYFFFHLFPRYFFIQAGKSWRKGIPAFAPAVIAV